VRIILKREVVPVHAMKAYRGVGVQLHSLSTSAIDDDAWLTSRPGHFTRWKETRYSLNRRLDGLQWTFMENRKIFPQQKII
jgi:hypothetical protein